jgi:hypothetical protein
MQVGPGLHVLPPPPSSGTTHAISPQIGPVQVEPAGQ